ncbi:MAG: efflux RND transporter periplasmic adaptor subunit [Bacteroidales bacterium]|jgi:RND family efflux transporter MFP subunit|nr:efflux RND transporter periplasmic adaptor subunit [Bacteroidales bacterium]
MMKKYTLLLYIFFALGFFSCGNKNNTKTSEKADDPVQQRIQELPQVSVITAERGVFLRELQSNGRLAALNKVDLRFRTSELIKSISVSNGEQVEAGQEIARIEDFNLRNRVITSRETVRRSEVTLEDHLLQQGYRLKDTASVPSSVMEYGYTHSQLLSSKVALAEAEYALERAVLRSPIAGVVTNLSAREHNLSSTDVFCTIVGDKRFEVEFPVLESEIGLLLSAHEVQIELLAYPGMTIKGRLNGMNPVVDKNGMVLAKAIVDNTQGKLYEGMNVRVLVQQAIPDKLVVPKSAVVLRSDRQVLFVYAQGRSQWRYVETGLENSREYTIEKELEPGEQVIITGNFNLAHDVEVEIIEN